ncbi:DoxX family protein [Dyadobacter sp. CY323]|uniref:DoxX family protein n=1 Tax=Dyadobacter sp. CY323 TaxID=2907302 RepID=UPI001F43FC1B|nr:DoxX family protein [Dyadobacter sp. CY323]MCE6992012.1 DoxX family protein [Dyadobacter sp. CY323]
MTTKTKRIVATVLIAIPTLVLIIGGLLKILNKEPESVMQFLTEAGFGNYILLLGLGELIIAALLIYPKTIKIGFLLASSYFGGALCLEISGGQPPVSAVFLTILWVGMFLKEQGMFLLAPAEN